MNDASTVPPECGDVPDCWWVRPVSDWVDFCQCAEAAAGTGVTPGNAFRGQSKDSWSLEPSLVRLAKAASLSASDAIEVEKRITSEFSSMAHLHLPLPQNPILAPPPWWPLMQHYGAPTRLLDWTMSPYVAAYCAVEQNWDSDGIIWGFSIENLRAAMRQQFGGDNASDDPKLVKLLTELNAPLHVSVVSSAAVSDRMAAQQGCFTLCTQVLADHADAIVSLLASEPGHANSFKLVIGKELKPDFLRRLRRMNITASSLFPGVDGLGRSLAELVRLARFGA